MCYRCSFGCFHLWSACMTGQTCVCRDEGSFTGAFLPLPSSSPSSLLAGNLWIKPKQRIDRPKKRGRMAAVRLLCARHWPQWLTCVTHFIFTLSSFPFYRWGNQGIKGELELKPRKSFSRATIPTNIEVYFNPTLPTFAETFCHLLPSSPPKSHKTFLFSFPLTPRNPSRWLEERTVRDYGMWLGLALWVWHSYLSS